METRHFTAGMLGPACRWGCGLKVPLSLKTDAHPTCDPASRARLVADRVHAREDVVAAGLHALVDLVNEADR